MAAPPKILVETDDSPAHVVLDVDIVEQRSLIALFSVHPPITFTLSFTTRCPEITCTACPKVLA